MRGRWWALLTLTALVLPGCKPAVRDAPPKSLAGPTPRAMEQTNQTPTPASSPSPPPSLDINTFPLDAALEAARVLAVDIGARPTGSEAETRAADYLESAFSTLGYAVQRPEFIRADGGPSTNVVARSPRADYTGGYLVVGGHYDTVPGSPGANDNASGTGVVVALAQMFKGFNLPVEFVGFSGEERHPVSKAHHEGSLAYVSALADPSTVKAMLSIDMIGAGPKILIVRDRASSAAFQAELAAAASAAGVPYGLLSRGDISDHTSFTKKGIPGLLLWTGRHPTFHKPGDTFSIVEPEAVRRAGLMAAQWLKQRHGL